MKVLALCLSILLLASNAFALRDEMQTSDPDKAITNRPMDRNYNLQSVQTAFDKAKGTESVQEWAYSPDTVYKLRLREWMHTSVVLPENENIVDFSLGDEGNFVFLPQPGEGNVFKFIVYGIMPGADTSLTVHGESGNIYPFYLRIDDHTSKFLPDLLVRLKDPRLKTFKSKKVAKLEEAAADPFAPKEQGTDVPDYLRTISNTPPSDWTFTYQIDPADSPIAPRQVFDDGIFTYFRFGSNGNMDRIGSLPVVWRVMDGHDALVNTRVEGEFLVAETINPNWTIRSGDKWVCARQTPAKR
ncbi:MAG: TrbG/VirB9 family P-type conjugative transfer protein [Sphaerochaeta sp.]|nr:TrbG/VirB9 family P-type conjugative transfer protein [Sphaerochaeta sp.]